MMKKALWKIVAVCAMAGVIFAGFVYTKSVLETRPMEAVGKAVASNTNFDVIATVNGEPITQAELESSKSRSDMAVDITHAMADTLSIGDEERQMLEDGTAYRTVDQLLDAMIQRRLLLQEAKRLGIEVSDEEAREYMRAEAAFLQEYKGQLEGYEEMNAAVDAYAKGLGMTREEYDEKIMLPAYKNELTIGKLAKYVTSDKEFQRVNGVIDVATYKEQLIEQAEIVYAEGFVPEGDEAK